MTCRVIAVDGPAGAGKSTVSQRLALEMGFGYVDSGAMYRAIGVLAGQRGLDLKDSKVLAALCDETSIEFEEKGGVLLTIVGGQDLSEAIRAQKAGELASKVSAVPAVRERLVARQRAMGTERNIVMEGRDIGTVVFPDAGVKVFLTATVEERARRRCAQLAERGISVDPADVRREIAERDRRDESREHSPLRPALGALVIDTTNETISALVQRIREEAARVWNPCNSGGTAV